MQRAPCHRHLRRAGCASLLARGALSHRLHPRRPLRARGEHRPPRAAPTTTALCKCERVAVPLCTVGCICDSRRKQTINNLRVNIQLKCLFSIPIICTPQPHDNVVGNICTLGCTHSAFVFYASFHMPLKYIHADIHIHIHVSLPPLNVDVAHRIEVESHVQ